MKKKCEHMVWHARAWIADRYVMEPIRQCKRAACVPTENPRWCHKHEYSALMEQRNDRLQDIVAELAYMGLPPTLINSIKAFKFQ